MQRCTNHSIPPGIIHPSSLYANEGNMQRYTNHGIPPGIIHPSSLFANYGQHATLLAFRLKACIRQANPQFIPTKKATVYAVAFFNEV